MAIDEKRIDFVYSPLDLTVSTGSSTGAAVPLASVAAGSASIRNICKRVQISMSTSSASVQVPVTIQLFDGASSTGTVLSTWQATPAAASGLSQNPVVLDFDNLHIRGTAATAMALSGPVGGAAGTLIGLNLHTYQFPRQPTGVALNANS